MFNPVFRTDSVVEMRVRIFSVLVLFVCLATFSLLGAAPAKKQTTNIESGGFDDSPLKEPIIEPGWFKLSFLEIRDDIEEAKKAKKRGLMIYFGQKRCPYCKKFLENNFGKKDVLKYIQKHFDVISINVRGNKTVTDLANKSLTERQYAVNMRANFTPTLIFYDTSGKQALRLVGYQSPYRFRAAMEYVADRHYRKENFRAYLDRGDKDEALRLGEMNKKKFFDKPPFMLDRSRFPASRPLLVLFEQGQCHSCDVLHTEPFADKRTLKRLANFEIVQLNMWAKTPVVTPSGEKTTARKWADKLNIHYAPTLVFFDENGKEIIRSASVVHFYRLNNVLQYVLERGYRKFGSYRAWRVSHSATNKK